ncbi:hypothetical protein [Leptospira ryugenii]|uniref:hypothetical protein n=1 Tax=Leptospira ryugenii TaxID=1917863 RepID=UPI00107F6CA9|nr:hypothetical protein [Leptospira ryugenii]
MMKKSFYLNNFVFSFVLAFLLCASFFVCFSLKSKEISFVECTFCKDEFHSIDPKAWLIVYPGIVGCTKQCPLALAKLKAFRKAREGQNISFLYLVMDENIPVDHAEDSLQAYKKELPIQTYHPKGDKRKFFQRLGAYLPISPVLKERDEHNSIFFCIPPSRDRVYVCKDLDHFAIETLSQPDVKNHLD